MWGIILGLLGATAGYLTGLGATAVSIGWMVGSTIGAVLDFKAPGAQEGPRLEDLTLQTATYGVPIRHVYGQGRLAGNVLWYSGIHETRHSKKVKVSNGFFGLFGKKYQKVISYSYSVSLAVGICEGPVSQIRRIWADSKLIYDVTPEAVIAQGVRWAALRLYTGTETQTPDPAIAAAVGAANTPGHRGLVYAVFDGLQLATFGNRVPQLEFEVIAGADAHAFYQWETKPFEASNLVLDRANPALAWYLSAEDQVARINTITHEVSYSPTLDFGLGDYGLPDMDESGYLYVAWFVAPNTCYLHAIDTRTWAATPTFVGQGGALDVKVDEAHGLVWTTELVGTECFAFSLATLALVVRVSLPWTGRWIATDRDGHAWVVSLSGAQFARVTPEGAASVWDLSASYGEIQLLSYFEPDHSLILGTVTPYAVIKWDIATESVAGAITEDVTPHTWNQPNFKFGPFAGRLWVGNGIAWAEIDCASMTVLREVRQIDYDLDTTTVLRAVYHPLTHSLLGDSSAASVQMYLDRYAGTGVPLPDVVAHLCAQAGLDAIETADLNPYTVRGYVRDNQMSARRALEPLQLAYYFDAAESDDVIKFRRRGGATVATVQEDDLAAHAPGEEPPAPVIMARRQEMELPRELAIEYLDAATEYERGIQRSRRLATQSRETRTVTLPLLMSADEAKRCAEIGHSLVWTERTRYEVRLGPEHLRLEPGDVIEVVSEAAQHRLLLTRTSLSPPAILECEALADDAAVYVSDALGAEGDGTVLSHIRYPGPTRLELLDMPSLSVLSDDAGFYAGAASEMQSQDWEGAAVYKSADDGASFALVTVMPVEATLGAATTLVAEPDTYAIWDGRSVEVILAAGTLSASTDAAVLNGANLAAIGAHGRWELVQFVDVVDLGHHQYRLSRLLRGRYGTEHAGASHAVGDSFVLIQREGEILRLPDALATLGEAALYRADTLGDPFENQTYVEFTNTGAGLKPYSPVNLQGARDDANNLTITWRRRARFQPDWPDSEDIPLHEDSEAYEVDILSGETVLRTIDALTSATAGYSAADQSSDGLTPGEPVSVRVYQMSAAVGRGYPGTATV